MRSCADLATAVRQRRTQERSRWREWRYCAALAPVFSKLLKPSKLRCSLTKLLVRLESAGALWVSAGSEAPPHGLAFYLINCGRAAQPEMQKRIVNVRAEEVPLLFWRGNHRMLLPSAQNKLGFIKMRWAASGHQKMAHPHRRFFKSSMRVILAW